MKILIVSQYFYPEEFKINDLAETLVLKGHEVTVLTGKPNYPKGEYFDGYSFKGIVQESYKGAKVIRVPLIKRSKGGAKNLILNYFSFVHYARKYLKNNKINVDAIICFEISPITQAYPCIECKKRYGGKILLWVQDLWPESVTAAGGIYNKLVLNILDKMVKGIYDKSDKLMIQSPAFAESILSKGNYKDKLAYVPNWAEDIFINNERIKREKFASLMPEGFKVMFAGNIGAAQDFESIIKAANETKEVPAIKWVIVGDGRARLKAEADVKKLGLDDTVIFVGRHPVEDMPSFFVHADAMLVSLRDEYIFSLTIPSKVQCYMAAGKPILTMLNGIGNKIVKEARCGLTANAGDYKSLAQNVKTLYNKSKEELFEMGKCSASYYNSHFDKNTVVNCIVKLIEND